jgi:hypothetical protein
MAHVESAPADLPKCHSFLPISLDHRVGCQSLRSKLIILISLTRLVQQSEELFFVSFAIVYPDGKAYHLDSADMSAEYRTGEEGHTQFHISLSWVSSPVG